MRHDDKLICLRIDTERHLLMKRYTFAAAFIDDGAPVCPPIQATALTLSQAERTAMPVILGTAIQRRANAGAPLDLTGIMSGRAAAWAVNQARRWWTTHEWDENAMERTKPTGEPATGFRITADPQGRPRIMITTPGGLNLIDPDMTRELRHALDQWDRTREKERP